MHVMRWLVAAACLAALLLAGFVWLAEGMGPLGALSLPFSSALVRAEPSPCILNFATAAGDLDRTAFARAFKAYVAANGFHADDDDAKPPGTRRLATYTGPGTLNLLVFAQPGRVSVQLFKDDHDTANYTKEVNEATSALEGLGLKRVACQ